MGCARLAESVRVSWVLARLGPNRVAMEAGARVMGWKLAALVTTGAAARASADWRMAVQESACWGQ